MRHFSYIFGRLDADGDGYISSQRIDIGQLDAGLLGVMQPLLSELEETGHTLNVEEFIDATYRLYDSLAPP